MEVQNFIDIRLYVLLITLICYSIINNYLINGSSEVKYFIGCNKWKKTDMRIPLGVNISYLQEFFKITMLIQIYQKSIMQRYIYVFILVINFYC